MKKKNKAAAREWIDQQQLEEICDDMCDSEFRMRELGDQLRIARTNANILLAERNSLLEKLQSDSFDAESFDRAMVVESRLDEARSLHRLLLLKARSIAKFL